MITISALIGVGLYVRGGLILRLGGPIAVLLAFFLLGLLAWAVMQCLAEMLCMWPISGALVEYVSEFVDPELGVTVGVMYWYILILGRHQRNTFLIDPGLHTQYLSPHL